MNIQINDTIYKKLSDLAGQENMTPAAVLEKALDTYCSTHPITHTPKPHPSWPQSLVDFEGDPNFPTAEELRALLWQEEIHNI